MLPQELVEVSARAVEMMDRSIENLNRGVAGNPLDLSRFGDDLNDRAIHQESMAIIPEKPNGNTLNRENSPNEYRKSSIIVHNPQALRNHEHGNIVSMTIEHAKESGALDELVYREIGKRST